MWGGGGGGGVGRHEFFFFNARCFFFRVSVWDRGVIFRGGGERGRECGKKSEVREVVGLRGIFLI